MANNRLKFDIPKKSRREVVTCPLVSSVRELVTLKSCLECDGHAGFEEGDEYAHKYVRCCFPRMIPIREVRGS